MSRPALEVADIFRDHGAAWRTANRGHVSLAQMKVMSAIERCRTPARLSVLWLDDARHRGLRAGRDAAPSADADGDPDRHVMIAGNDRDNIFRLLMRWHAAGADPARPRSAFKPKPTPERPPLVGAPMPARHYLACRSAKQRASPAAFAPRNGRRRKLKSP
jgi:hypothetical protein